MPARIIIGTKARLFWFVLVAFSPIAYAIGSHLVSRYDPVAQIQISYDRAKAIEIASTFAKAKQLDVSTWESYVRVLADNPLRTYYRATPGPDLERLNALVPPVTTSVLFRHQNPNQRMLVTLSPDGRVLGYARSSEQKSEIDPGEASSLQLAKATIPEWLSENEIRLLGEPAVEEQRSQNALTRKYSWKFTVPSHPDLALAYTASVNGDQVMSTTVSSQLSEDFLNKTTEIGGFAIRMGGRRVGGPSSLLFALAVILALVLGFYRFVQRARQRELSYKRISILAVTMATLFLLVILLTDIATYEQAMARYSTLLPVYIFGTISYLFMGLFVGLAYGAGEGDLREGYPGKLTSFDALLTGKLFSRDVARAVVTGTAIGGWGLLFYEIVPYLWRNFPMAGKQIASADFLLGRFPWLSPFVILPIDVIFAMTIGLLIPIPFIRRRTRNIYLIVLFSGLFAWMASTGGGNPFSPFAGAALLGMVRAALLLIPFFRFDLLTSIVSLAAPTFVTTVVSFYSQPSPSLKSSALISLAIGVIYLVIEVYFAYRGRVYSEDEVGPQYALHLAERLKMQAEVSAAREAQIRLMPSEMPQPQGLTIAAECRPAQEVGGDFYEVFSLDENRTGIFMVEGGGKGLASALSIAFAKGYILPKIKGSHRADDSPLEIIRGLQSQLRKTVPDNNNFGVVYAVIDSSDGTLRYARTGTYPGIWVTKEGRTGPITEAESQTNFSGAGDSGFSVTSAMHDLAPGDSVMFFTDGLAAHVTTGDDQDSENLWKEAMVDRSDSRDVLKTNLAAALNRADKRAERLGVSDDLTALIVRLRGREKQ